MEQGNGVAASTSAKDIYTRVTRHIVEALEHQSGGDLPWHHATGLPVNAATGRPYRGVNTLVLWVTAAAAGYGSPRWATFRQWQTLGKAVRRNEKATVVVFWKQLGAGRSPDDRAIDAELEDDRPRFVARGYPVFNADQLGDADGDGFPEQPGTCDAAEHLVAALRPDIRHGGDVAYYHPTDDYIRMPRPDSYPGRPAYYSTLAHELTHWTGSPARLARDLTGRFGSAAYAMEELVAELGSAFLCAHLGFEAEPRPDHARYIASWLEVFRRDTKAVFAAASRAQAAVDWMWTRQSENHPKV